MKLWSIQCRWDKEGDVIGKLTRWERRAMAFPLASRGNVGACVREAAVSECPQGPRQKIRFFFSMEMGKRHNRFIKATVSPRRKRVWRSSHKRQPLDETVPAVHGRAALPLVPL